MACVCRFKKKKNNTEISNNMHIWKISPLQTYCGTKLCFHYIFVRFETKNCSNLCEKDKTIPTAQI